MNEKRRYSSYCFGSHDVIILDEVANMPLVLITPHFMSCFVFVSSIQISSRAACDIEEGLPGQERWTRTSSQKTRFIWHIRKVSLLNVASILFCVCVSGSVFFSLGLS